MAADLAPAAAAAARCLGIGPGDDVLVVCNRPQRAIADALVAAAVPRARTVELLEYPTQTRHGEEPPAVVARAMLRATAVIAVTVFSLSHTRARVAATERGTRIASMPALGAEVFARALPTDYSRLEGAGRELARALTATARCRLTSPAGTDVVLGLEGRTAISDDGDLRAPGAFGNLPAGEAFIAPLETAADGVIVLDGSLAGHGLLREPLQVTVSAGRITAASGEGADRLLRTLDAGGPTGRTIAELGIGTNPGAVISGAICEDEKVAGTAHVAFGNNATFGGVNRATVHIDGVILRPTVELDGRSVLTLRPRSGSPRRAPRPTGRRSGAGGR